MPFSTLTIHQYFPHPRAQVAVSRMYEQEDIGSHHHEFLEIAYILAGSGQHVTGEIRHVVGPGDVLVINHRRAHGYEQTKGLNLVNILVRDDAMAEARQEFGSLPGFHTLFTLEPVRWRRNDFAARMRLTAREMRTVGEWVESLETETQSNTDVSRFLARNWLMLIIGFLSRCYDRRPDRPEEPDRRLAQLLSRIDTKPEDNYRVADMARAVAMSQRSLFRSFQEATGHAPAEYVIRARIRLSVRYLSHTGQRLPITEIAFLCGFHDSNYFSRQFRRVMGMAPSQYR